MTTTEHRHLLVAGPHALTLVAGDAGTDPAEDGVVVDIRYCGICATDTHGYQAAVLPQAVFGHEWTGTVSAVGSQVSHVTVGQRVAVAVGPACGTCSYCVAGHTTHCEAVLAEAMGIADDAPSHGGFATRIRVSGRRVIAVPDSMADVEAALLEPAAVAFHAVRRAEIPFGAIVVVQGAGPIGLLTAQCARNAGASTIIISEPTPKRRESARALGFDTVVAPERLADTLSEATSGRGADVVFECAGVASLLRPTADLVRRGGQLSLVGFPADLSEVSYSDWQIRELTVVVPSRTHTRISSVRSQPLRRSV
ncbi:(R,R)-butanediol dehydrogenase/meso-butanediol dehydrogenase/diacetyl reductase [Gordonia amarae]|uniref:Putative zinc-containing alcohol dehydrogenase n=1 Tax=Gordonia amarae NBRC 15530 TaxID=1075090 RepID=G7GKS5_9ACTN|nr:zinc-binding dehydrogenase [Gordonia amarae]MCS3879357.1 (R,R)-butanediol dehydrogenase/meso-butanediol dehydrogenase/diacetyl reductase [Gordonia amarae]GAB04200.1 putative zinc-containing alcohol dehydrogenase [Gordonia amarae NBRC 15530]